MQPLGEKERLSGSKCYGSRKEKEMNSGIQIRKIHGGAKTVKGIWGAEGTLPTGLEFSVHETETDQDGKTGACGGTLSIS